MWQTLETKARFIQQVMRGETSVRSAEDLESGALTYAEIKATVSGPKASPLFWMTTSNLFETPVSTSEGKKQVNRRLYLLQPEFILKNIWATPLGNTLHSLSEV